MKLEPRDSKHDSKKYVLARSASAAAAARSTSPSALQLPQGARITSLDYRYIDNDGGRQRSLALVGYDTFEKGSAVTDTWPRGEQASQRRKADRERLPCNAAANVKRQQYSYQLELVPVRLPTATSMVSSAPPSTTRCPPASPSGRPVR